jgi:HD-GYP domain-containing protein (c-di-GMP phosphodiesterase class II)
MTDHRTFEKRIFYTTGVDALSIRELLKSDSLRFDTVTCPADIPDDDHLSIIFASAAWITQYGADLPAGDQIAALRTIHVLVDAGDPTGDLSHDCIDDIHIGPLQGPVLQKKVRSAFFHLQERRESRQLKILLQQRSHELQQVSSVGAMLMSEKDLDRLLHLILLKSREITAADAGSLYLVEQSETGEPRLRFKLSQNDSLDLCFSEFTLPLSESSIAGWVGVNGRELNLPDVYTLDADKPFQFNIDFDKKVGYRTKSMLTLPLLNHEDDIIGVLQLINRKRDAEAVLTPETVEDLVIPFGEHAVELVNSLAGGAAVSIENNLLYRSIEALFEGFVNAAVTAIESRDPTTAGHSSRVASLTCKLAEVVDRVDTGCFKDMRFSAEQMKEMRYASLLHDFGKVGVREAVLLKANKLYPWVFQDVCRRMHYWKKSVENANLSKKIEFLEQTGNTNKAEVFKALDADFTRQIERIDQFLQVVTVANEPTVVESEQQEMLEELARESFLDIGDVVRPVLSDSEYAALSIRKGSLDEKERLEIESHVTHTFKFLRQVPWTRDLSRIPEIAHGHHEKLNGGGYPRGIIEKEIPFQARIMSICDIFDALTAADRPYKRAVPVPRALNILDFEVKDQHVDPDLVRMFTEAKVFEIVGKTLDD